MTSPEILPQQVRENPDPQEDTRPAPRWVLVLIAALIAFCIAYIADAGLETPSSWGDGRTAEELQSRVTNTSEAVNGAAIYASLCAACHQANGAGLPGVFPPLAGSEWVTGKETTLAALVLNGVNGPLTVKGKTYNGAMPAFKAQLDDAQIAAVLTHLRSSWENASPPVSAALVANIRQASSARTTPYEGENELSVVP